MKPGAKMQASLRGAFRDGSEKKVPRHRWCRDAGEPCAEEDARRLEEEARGGGRAFADAADTAQHAETAEHANDGRREGDADLQWQTARSRWIGPRQPRAVPMPRPGAGGGGGLRA